MPGPWQLLMDLPQAPTVGMAGCAVPPAVGRIPNPWSRSWPPGAWPPLRPSSTTHLGSMGPLSKRCPWHGPEQEFSMVGPVVHMGPADLGPMKEEGEWVVWVGQCPPWPIGQLLVHQPLCGIWNRGDISRGWGARCLSSWSMPYILASHCSLTNPCE